MQIILHDMEFHAFHGVFPEEREQGNTFLVNLTLELPEPAACHTDQLNDTFNYQLAYDAVKIEMEVPSQLLEHVAMRIKQRLLTQFQQLTAVRVRISKKNPPLGGIVPWVSVEI